MTTATPTIPSNESTPTSTYLEITFDVEAARQELAANWKWVLAGGVLSVAGGIAAILAPVFATAAVGTFIAASLLVVGIINLCGPFFAPKGMKLDSFLVGVIQVLMAAVLVFYPIQSGVSMTIIIAGVLMLQGVARIALGWAAWDMKGSGWVVASGVATVTMCCVIISGLPQAALWVIGMLFGFDMVSHGSARVSIALEGRKIANATKA